MVKMKKRVGKGTRARMGKCIAGSASCVREIIPKACRNQCPTRMVKLRPFKKMSFATEE